MRYSIFLVALFFYCNVFSQNYFSTIVPTIDNPLAEKVVKHQSKYIIPTDFFSSEGVKGGLLIVSDHGIEIDNRKYTNTDLGLAPIVIYDENIYLAGEAPSTEGDSSLICAKINPDNFELEWVK